MPNYKSQSLLTGGVIASTTAPVAHIGQRWFNTATGVTYQYTIDAAGTTFWLDISSGGIGAAASRGVDIVGDIDPHLETSTTGAGLALGSVYYNREADRYFVCTTTTTNANVWAGRFAGFGGTETTYKSGSDFYRSHTFYVSGEFLVDSTISCDILILAGGGAGGASYWSGGGGAGGMLEKTGVSMTAQTYVVTVGAGAAQGPQQAENPTPGLSGFASSVSIISAATAYGGGGGGAFDGGTSPASHAAAQTADADGNALGSGGGGLGYTSASGGSGTSGQGSNGGTGSGNHGNPTTGGGGGGKGGVGETGANGDGGAGGNGAQNSYRTGSAENYAAGGGGSTWSGPAGREGGAIGGVTIGGVGGASAGGHPADRNGVRNTGSGGGAGYGSEHDAGGGGAGGSGIVVIKYQINA